MEGTYREVFQLLDRDGSGELPVETFRSCVYMAPGLPQRRSVKDQIAEWWDDPLDLTKFAELVEKVRLEFGLGSPSTIVDKLHVVLYDEIFRAIDGNRDGKISKAELRRFLEGLPHGITPQDVEQAIAIADLERNKHLTRDEFIAITEVLQEDRQDVSLPDMLEWAREGNVGTAADFESRARHVGKLIGASFASMKGTLTGKSSSSAGSPTSREAPSFPFARRKSNTPSSPVSETSPQRETVPKKLLSALNPKKVLSKTRSVSSPTSPSSTAPCPNCEKWYDQEIELRDQLAKEKREGAQRASEVQQLLKKIERLRAEKHVDGGAKGVSSKEESLQQELDECTLQKESLAAKVRELEERLATAKERMQKLQEDRNNKMNRMLEQDNELAQLRSKLHAVENELNAELERNKDLSKLRRTQAEDETKRRAELGKVKQELKRKDTELGELRKHLDDIALERKMEQLQLNEDQALTPTQPFISRGFDDDSSAGTPEHVVFLSPPGRKEFADNTQATLFDTPGQIYYTFPHGIYPTQLQFDLNIESPTVPEYITCRDGVGRRSFCAMFSQGTLIIPGTMHTAHLERGVWHELYVVFDWVNRTSTVYLGTHKLFRVPFRDPGASGINVFDIYPRTKLAVVYANLRFIAPAETEPGSA